MERINQRQEKQLNPCDKNIASFETMSQDQFLDILYLRTASLGRVLQMLGVSVPEADGEIGHIRRH